MLRVNCSLAASVWRRPIAFAAPYGLSDARAISLPEDALPWVRASFSDRPLRSARTLRWIIPVVMRIRDPRLRVRYATRS
jgi:hypothetical protein